jgi:hypothetical protein
MLDQILSWMVIFMPFAISIVPIFIPARHEDEKAHMRWRWILVAFGVLFSILAWWQQSRSIRAAAKDRQLAIMETSKQVAAETSRQVTKAVTEQYSELIADQKSKISDLQTQLAAQGRDVSVIKGSNIVTGKNPMKVEVINPSPNPPSVDTQSVNLTWTQERGSISDGKETVRVTFRVDGYLKLPAFMAICDKPCKTLSAAGIGMTQAGPLASTVQHNVAGALYMLPRPMPPGIDYFVNIISVDGSPIKVNMFRILKESELPPELK